MMTGTARPVRIVTLSKMLDKENSAAADKSWLAGELGRLVKSGGWGFV